MVMKQNGHLSLALKAAILAGRKIMDIYRSSALDISYKDNNSPLTKADMAAHYCIRDILSDAAMPILSEESRDISLEERLAWDDFWMVDPLDGTKEFIKKNNEFTVNIALIRKGKPETGVIYAPALGDLYYGSLKDGAFKVSADPGLLLKMPGNEELLRKYSIKLPDENPDKTYRVVASRSHLSDETKVYIEELRKTYPQLEIISKGSSLKLCMIAEGKAFVYPRFGPTMEWDIAAGHALLKAAGKEVYIYQSDQTLTYNKENLLNPWFIAR